MREVEQERKILSTLLCSPDSVSDLCEGFGPQAFRMPEHRRIFALLQSQFIAPGKRIDLVEFCTLNPDPRLAELVTGITGEGFSFNGTLGGESEKLLNGNDEPDTFAPLTIPELQKVLGQTIRQDEPERLAVFLCMLTAYLSDPLNIAFTAPSSSGKTHITREIVALFPEEDVIALAYASPASFFHEQGTFDKEQNAFIVDLRRKILLFWDMPHPKLLEALRPFFSHDKRKLEARITDKSDKGGNRTKRVILWGFPATIFCSAGLRFDSQEQTRFLIISPGLSQSKLWEAVDLTIDRGADQDGFNEEIERNPDRQNLIYRIPAIRDSGISEVKIPPRLTKAIKERFRRPRKIARARYSRDVVRILGLIKALALLNLWHRERDGNCIFINEGDVEAGFTLWDQLGRGSELGISRFVFDFYLEVVCPLYEKKNRGKDEADRQGLTIKELLQEYSDIHGSSLNANYLRGQIIPALESADLIYVDKDPADRRNRIIIPTFNEKLT